MLSPLHNCWFSGRCPPVLHIRIPKQHAGAERLFPVQLQKFLCFRGNIDDTLQESTVQHADSFCLCHQFHRTGGKPRAQCRGFPKHQQQCVRAEEQPVLGRIFLMCLPERFQHTRIRNPFHLKQCVQPFPYQRLE